MIKWPIAVNSAVKGFFDTDRSGQNESSKGSRQEPPPTKYFRWNNHLRNGSLLFFGVVLPLITFIFELVSHACRQTLFDPIPNILLTVLVGMVPVANLFAWLHLRGKSILPERALWLFNAAACAVSVSYAIAFGPVTPFAVIGILFMGAGLLALSPLFGFIAALRLKKQLRTNFAITTENFYRGWTTAFLTTVIILLLAASPPLLTRYWAAKATAGSNVSLQLLRNFGDRDVLLRDAYNSWNRSLYHEFLTSTPAEEASRLYFKVTGQPHTSKPHPDFLRARSQWDNGLGGLMVGGKLQHVSLVASRLDGLAEPQHGWAYLEWIMEFKNTDQFQQHEARSQIELPPGAVVSRLTLWVNGEEQEAAFAGRNETRAAYQKVAVQERRDPVLVTTSGRDTVLMQCFPISPNGGTMKVRLGITAPLILEDESSSILQLPRVIESNYLAADKAEQSVWIKSTYPASSAGLKLESVGDQHHVKGSVTPGKHLVHFQAPREISHTANHRGEGYVIQTLATEKAAPPRKLAVVIDGGASMQEFLPKLSKLTFPASLEISIWAARDGIHKIYEGKGSGLKPENWTTIKPVGGQDCIPALNAALDWGGSGSAVLWIHGPQPILIENTEKLEQSLRWLGNQISLLDYQVADGPNRLREKLSAADSYQIVPVLNGIESDLKRQFDLWEGKTQKQHFQRVLKSGILPENFASGSSHIVRLWAYDEIRRLIAARKPLEATQLAALHQLVTPVSGAVVLETKAQYDAAGLEQVDPSTVPTVPEPGTLALVAVGAIGLLLYRRLRIVS